MVRKTQDPRRVKILDALGRQAEALERWFRRLRRAVNACEKARRSMRRLGKRLECLDNPRKETGQ